GDQRSVAGPGDLPARGPGPALDAALLLEHLSLLIGALVEKAVRILGMRDLDVEILDVRPQVRDAPGDPLVVAHADARRPGERHPDRMVPGRLPVNRMPARRQAHAQA